MKFMTLTIYTLIILLYIYSFFKFISFIKNYKKGDLRKAIFPEDYE